MRTAELGFLNGDDVNIVIFENLDELTQFGLDAICVPLHDRQLGLNMPILLNDSLCRLVVGKAASVNKLTGDISTRRDGSGFLTFAAGPVFVRFL